MSFVNFVTITAKSGHAPTILSHLSEIKAEVAVKEPGTKKYHIAQSTEDENVIYLWEHYESKAAHTAHGEGEAYKVFKAARGEWIESLKIVKCDPVDA